MNTSSTMKMIMQWTETGISTVNPAGRNISPIANIAKNTAIPKILSTSRIPMNGGAGVVRNVTHTNVPTAGIGLQKITGIQTDIFAQTVLKITILSATTAES